MTNQKDSLQSDEASKRKGLRTRLHEFWHHLKVAIFVASCVYTLDHYNLLDGLQIPTLQLVRPDIFQKPTKPGSNESGSVKVITINDKLYETRFKQSSPLDRCELRKIFEEILNKKPKVLAVDLDLSPGPEGSTEEETALYKLLKQNTDTEIVLITPIKVYSDDLIDKKAQWMEDMCRQEHIHFGLPYLYSVKGVVLKYLSDPRSFAKQINRAASKGWKSDFSNKKICCNKDKQLNCVVNAMVSSNIFPKLKLINYYDFTDYIERIRIEDIDNTNRLKGSVVLLGGSYGSTDKYDTLVGTISGIFIHAASYYSVVNPANRLDHVSSYLVEIVMGLVTGVILCFFARNLKPLLFSIVSNLGFQLLFSYICVFISSILIHYHLWINPTLLIAGIGIHSLLVPSELELEANKKETQRETKEGKKRLDIRIKNIKCFFYYVITITSWVYIAEEFFEH